MGCNPKPLVEIPHRHPIDNREKSRGVEQAKEAISNAKLGQIRLASLGEEGDRFQGGSVSSNIGNFPTMKLF